MSSENQRVVCLVLCRMCAANFHYLADIIDIIDRSLSVSKNPLSQSERIVPAGIFQSLVEIT
ncbi:hypothetical protein MES4922_390025 [Mesorhizobium ventifaucium]|uniref:Uncharacterized protein n=1 Tax=Mesorhizobium ventifaucium TaxID=666020 RepID=A0ABM9E774_9HYPH|nr:hypothetical protein MES4922_390025 [Mesorhizobium ventifaucium]